MPVENVHYEELFVEEQAMTVVTDVYFSVYHCRVWWTAEVIHYYVFYKFFFAFLFSQTYLERKEVLVITYYFSLSQSHVRTGGSGGF